MGSESIAHEAEGQLVGKKYRDKTTLARLASSRPLGERSEPCLAARRQTTSVEGLF